MLVGRCVQDRVNLLLGQDLIHPPSVGHRAEPGHNLHADLCGARAQLLADRVERKFALLQKNHLRHAALEKLAAQLRPDRTARSGDHDHPPGIGAGDIGHIKINLGPPEQLIGRNRAQVCPAAARDQLDI